MRRWLWVIGGAVALAALLARPSPPAPERAVDALLARLDVDIVPSSPTAEIRTRAVELRVLRDGDATWCRIDAVHPADVAGMAVSWRTAPGEDARIELYLPALKRTTTLTEEASTWGSALGTDLRFADLGALCSPDIVGAAEVPLAGGRTLTVVTWSDQWEVPSEVVVRRPDWAGFTRISVRDIDLGVTLARRDFEIRR